jgi:hypothetical protein
LRKVQQYILQEEAVRHINILLDGDLVCCSNIQELREELQLEHTSEQWRLFTDSFKVSLNAVQ